MAQGTPTPARQAANKPAFLAPEDPVSGELIRAQVQKVLASPGFCHAERLSRFLRFAVEKALQGQPDQLKEYVLGVEVFDRNHNYDPHYDPIVRVEARRLRAKLAEYYEKAGHDGHVLISFPKGTYVPVFEQKAAADYAAERLPPALRWRAWLLSALALALIASGLLWWFYRSRGTEEPPELTRLAADFVAMGRPALSWDGKLVTYASTRTGEGQPDIWVQQVAGGPPMNVTQHPAAEVQPSFSPDGTQIVFNRGGLPSTRGIYVIPTFRGPERKIADFGTSPRFSPDGQWIAFDIGEHNPLAAKVYLVSSTGGTPAEFLPGVVSALLPHWSPDGKYLLFLGCSDSKKGDWDLWVAPLAGGNAMKTGVKDKIERMGFQEVYPGAWTPSGNGVIVWAERADSTRLLRISLSPKTFRAVGDPEHLTRGVTEDCCPSVSEDGRLAFKSVSRKTEIVALPLDAKSGKQAGEPREIAHGSFLNVTPSASADGKKIAYMIPHGATWELRLKDLDNDTERVLVPDVKSEIVPYPAMRPDGMKVAFPVEESQRPSIYIVDTALDATGKLQRICENCGTPYDWSHDGTKILYVPYHQPRPWPVCMLRVDARQRSELLAHPNQDLYCARFSPDGRWISFQTASGSTSTIYVVPFAEATLPKQSDWIEIIGGAFFDKSACWSPDGERLYFVGYRDGHGRCIWAQRLHRLTKRPVGEPFAVFHDHVPGSNKMARYIGDFWISQGGDQLFFSASRVTASIWMMQLKDP